ncbi:alpha/beta hydrolase [Actinobaculum suis]|uniref:alpha/beta hydrolase n=2 Tax=Actinobaculum suis TaxID=1657 RepID=UPI002100204F|nr:alpha/beta hydrolase [Actinobaculum suis]
MACDNKTMTSRTWYPDPLGADYEQTSLPLGSDTEGPVRATLIRKTPPRPPAPGLAAQAATAAPAQGAEPNTAPRFAFLAVHGWNDSFIHTELARTITALQGAFYAIDLRKYGRSLDRSRQTPGYIENFSTYFADLDAAWEAIAADLRETYGIETRADSAGSLAANSAAPFPLFLYGHSTGGLTASLYADARPGLLAGVVLNSPWLELQLTPELQAVARPAVTALASHWPRQALDLFASDFYARTVTAWKAPGLPSIPGAPPHTDDPFWTTGWIPDFDTRVSDPFPVRPGWLRAVLRGQDRVAAGLNIDAPILMLTSARSYFSRSWSEEMRSADIVLNVEQMWARAAKLGRAVSIVKFPGAIHDVVFSRRSVRTEVFRTLGRFITGVLGEQ